MHDLSFYTNTKTQIGIKQILENEELRIVSPSRPRLLDLTDSDSTGNIWAIFILLNSP